MTTYPVWRGPAGALDPADRVRIDEAIEVNANLGAVIGDVEAARDTATGAAGTSTTQAGIALDAAGLAIVQADAAAVSVTQADEQRALSAAFAQASASSAQAADAARVAAESVGLLLGATTYPTRAAMDAATGSVGAKAYVFADPVVSNNGLYFWNGAAPWIKDALDLGSRLASVTATVTAVDGRTDAYRMVDTDGIDSTIEWVQIRFNAGGYILGGITADGLLLPAPELSEADREALSEASEAVSTLGPTLSQAVTDLADVSERTSWIGTVDDETLDTAYSWSLVRLNEDGFILGGITAEGWLPTAAGGGASSDMIAQMDARNMARSRSIMETPMVSVQLPVRGWNVAINYGQSLAEGETTAPALSRAAVPGVYMMGDNVDNITPPSTSTIPYTVIGTLALNPLIARTHSQEGLASYNLSDAEEAALAYGAVNRGEVPIIATVNGVKRALDRLEMGESERRIIAISPAFAARNVASLSKGTALYGVLIDGLQKAITLAEAEDPSLPIAVPAISYLQGEQDYSVSATPGTTREGYEALLNTLLDDLAADTMAETGQAQPPLVLLGQTTKQWTAELDANGVAGLSIGMAQIDVALSRRDTVLVGPTYPYTNTGGHLDANGSRWYGCHAAKVAKRISQGKGWQPTRIIAIERESDTQILVSFHVPVPPLQFKPIYGFEGVTIFRADRGFRMTSADRSTVYPVTGVEIVGQTMIRVTSSAPIPDTAIIWLAGRDGGVVGTTNVCDSDPEVAFDRYEYLPERGMPAHMSIPDLNDQPYPLQNWACAFAGSIGYTEFL